MRETGLLHCWGYNDPTGTMRPPEVPFVQYDMGGNNGCGLKEDDSVECWGRIALTSTVPEGRFKAVAVDQGACAVTLDDKVVCWAEEAEELTNITPPADLQP